MYLLLGAVHVLGQMDPLFTPTAAQQKLQHGKSSWLLVSDLNSTRPRGSRSPGYTATATAAACTIFAKADKMQIC